MKFHYYYGNQADQFSFVKIPRMLLVDPLFAPLSLPAKMLYGVLLDRMGISMRNGWFDEKNRVYIIYQISEIQVDLGFSKKYLLASLFNAPSTISGYAAEVQHDMPYLAAQ